MKKLLELYKKYREIFWYLVVGGLTTLVGYGTKAIFHSVCNFGTSVVVLLSWACAVLFAFLPNKLLVFGKRKGNILFEFISFASSRFATFVFDLFFTKVTVDILGYNFYLMMVISSVVVLILNYVFSKLITFRKKEEAEKKDEE